MAHTTRFRAPRLARAALGGAFTLLACNSMLGIEDAHVDPTLGVGGGATGGGGSASTQGGNSTHTGGASENAGETSAAGKAASGGQTNTGGVAQGGDAPVHSGGSVAEGGDGGAGAVGPGGEAGAGGEPGTVSLCEQYCSSVTQYCINNSLQFKDKEQCLKVCSLFPQGAIGDPDANTVACRLKYAEKAHYAGGTELASYCRAAGSGGDGRCGTNCDGFCTITMDTCTAETTSPYFFPNNTACQTTCQGLPDIPFVYGDTSVADGNSVQCRLFHVISAAMTDPEEHCAHVMGLTLCEQ